MLDQVRRLLSFLRRSRPGPGTGTGVISLEELHEETQRLVYENRIQSIENEKSIAKLKLQKDHEEGELDGLSDILKRCRSRKIQSLQERIERLDRCGIIYNHNIDLHESLIEKIEEMKVAGLKTATIQQVEEITCDLEEQRQVHQDIIGTAKALLG